MLTLPLPSFEITSVALTQNAEFIVLASQNGKLWTLDRKTNQTQYLELPNHPHITKLAVWDDGNGIAAASSDRVYFSGKNIINDILTIDFSNDFCLSSSAQKILYLRADTNAETGKLETFDLKTAQIQQHSPSPVPAKILNQALSNPKTDCHTDPFVISAGYNRKGSVLNLVFERVKEFTWRTPTIASAISVNHDVVAFANASGVWLYHLDGTFIQLLGINAKITALAFSSNGETLAVLTQNNIILWHTVEIIRQNKMYEKRGNLAFAPFNHLL